LQDKGNNAVDAVKGCDDASDSVAHVSSDSRSTRDDEEGTNLAA
jgi:hypothetical protein